LTSLSKELLFTANYPETETYFNELERFLNNFRKEANLAKNLHRSLATHLA